MTLQNLPWPAVLASASPRRHELLRRLIPQFEIDAADLDEDALMLAHPVETAERLALAKALAVAVRHPGKLVIGADTVVALEERQYGKPRSADDAVEMLLELSGKEHRVISGVALVWPGGQQVFSDVALVRFREIRREEAEEYAASGEPMDKAGAYAIQGGAAGFVVNLSGDVETVIGLPVEMLKRALVALA